MNLNELLIWLGTAGGSSIAVSWILEQISSFQLLESKLKKWVYFSACLVLAIGSYCVLTYVPAEILNAIAPFFNIVIVVFISNFIGEGFHAVTKE